MADETLDLQIALTDPAGATFYALKSGVDYEITYANLIAALSTAISDLQTEQNKATQTVVRKTQSSAFIEPFVADTLVERIDFRHVSGSNCLVKIGTSVGASDIMPELQVPAGEDMPVTINKSWDAATDIYITITTGTVDVQFDYKLNRFA